jgi:hypothetical protein
MKPVAPLLAARSSDEYEPMPLRPIDRHVIDRTATAGHEVARRLGLSEQTWFTGRMGTAATLRALNDAHGEAFFEVPLEATTDEEAADDAFAANGPVIDVQTHLVRPSRSSTRAAAALFGFLRMVDPVRWSEPIDLSQLSAPA